MAKVAGPATCSMVAVRMLTRLVAKDADCPLGGPRAVARARRWPPVGAGACCNSASLACRLDARQELDRAETG
jgi:hypothetical protein